MVKKGKGSLSKIKPKESELPDKSRTLPIPFKKGYLERGKLEK